MSGSVNKVILVGNLGRDPEVRQFQSGGKVASFSLATSERWSDRESGEKRERTEWHRVAIYDERLVRVAEDYLKSGSKVFLQGQLETRKWQDQNGNDRYSTEVVLRRFRSELVMLDSRGEGAPGSFRGGTDRPEAATTHHSSGSSSRSDSPSSQQPQGGFDDEIPF